jgi:nucleotide-binding universal stress UspA family protein
MFKKILSAHDGSEGAQRALGVALDLARQYRAALHVVVVEERSEFPASIDEVVEEKALEDRIAAKIVNRARSSANSRGVALETHVLAGHAVKAIVEFVRDGGFDLLVIGFMGHSALYDRIIGSTTERLVRLAPSTVLVVK